VYHSVGPVVGVEPDIEHSIHTTILQFGKNLLEDFDQLTYKIFVIKKFIFFFFGRWISRTPQEMIKPIIVVENIILYQKRVEIKFLYFLLVVCGGVPTHEEPSL